MLGIPIPFLSQLPDVDISAIVDGDSIVFDAATETFVPGQGQAFTLFPIWAEENGTLANNSREWSFGNGSTGNVNIVLPVEADLFGFSFQAESGIGDASVHVLKNDAIEYTSPQFGPEQFGNFEILTTPVPYNIGDALGFRTNIENGNLTDCRVCAWFRIPANILGNAVLNDLLDVSLGGIADGQILRRSGSLFIPADLDKAAVGLDQVDNTADIDKPVSNPQQTALDGKIDIGGNISDLVNDENFITGAQVPNFETVTSISLVGNILTFIDEAGNATPIDLAVYLDDTNLSRLTSGSLDGVTGIATFERDDGSTFPVDFSAFLGGITDHGALTGLTDDDHPQYLNNVRGDIRYYTKTQLDNGQLDSRYYTETEIDAQQLVQDNDIAQNAAEIAAVDAIAQTALQPGDNISELNNDENFITGLQVPLFETLTGLAKIGNDLIYTKEDGNTDVIDLSIYLDDTNLSRIVNGSVDNLTGIATFERDDGSTFPVDFSAFLGTTQARIVSGALNGTTGDLTLTRDDTTSIVINLQSLQLDAGNIVSGTFADARISESSVKQHESALNILESQIDDLQDYLLNIVEDLTPSLGGNLDVNDKIIVSTDADRIRLLGNLLINGATQLRAFNVAGSGLAGRLSIQGFSNADNPGVELTVDNNASRVLMRLIRRGTSGTALQFYTEPDGGSIQNYMTLEDDGRLTFQAGGSIDLGDGNLTFSTGQIDLNNAGIRKSGSNLQFSNDNTNWIDLNDLVNSINLGDPVSGLANDAGYITAADVATNETLTSISKVGNDLIYVDENGNSTPIDLTQYLDDTNLSRIVNGTLDSLTGIATFERDDGSTFPLDLSSLLDNQNADQVPFTPNGDITATNTQDAIVQVRDNAAAALSDVAFVNINNNFSENQTIARNGSAVFEASSLDGGDAAIIFRSTGGVEPLWMIGNDGSTGNLRFTSSNGLNSALEMQLTTNSLDVRTKNIVNVVDPVNPQDAATKQYVDDLVQPQALGDLTDVDDSTNPSNADKFFNFRFNNGTQEYQLFEEFEQFVTETDPLLHQGTNLTTYLTMTVNFPVAGEYKLDANWTGSLNNTGDDLIVEVNEDGNTLFTSRLEPKDTAGTGLTVDNTTGGTTDTSTNQRDLKGGFDIITIPAPTTRTYTIEFAGDDTNQEATLYRAAMHIRRMKV